MFKLVLEKAEGPEIKLPTSAGSLKKQESSIGTSISALLTMPKPLIVWSEVAQSYPTLYDPVDCSLENPMDRGAWQATVHRIQSILWNVNGNMEHSCKEPQSLEPKAGFQIPRVSGFVFQTVTLDGTSNLKKCLPRPGSFDKPKCFWYLEKAFLYNHSLFLSYY